MNTDRLTDLRIIDELRDALADARQQMEGMVDAGDLQAAIRRAESAECLLDALRKADAERTGQLRLLSARYAGRPFAEDLDEILEVT